MYAQCKLYILLIALVAKSGNEKGRLPPMGYDPNFPIADQTAAMNIK
ncbi:hypothetical protein [Acinetobacter sp. SK-43]|nr:hypothetical protein [Acinetobacter sp. SK-43]